MIVTLLTENDESLPPSQEELQVWADEYKETFPVISDAERYIHSFAAKGKGEVKLPSFTLIGPGAELLIVDDDVTEADIIAALP